MHESTLRETEVTAGPDSEAMVTRSAEDYLKAVYALGDMRSRATIGRVAARLGVKPASASGMVRKLVDRGLLTHPPYAEISLTERGKVIALAVLRRHRVIESYLASRLGYSWDRVHAEAERLEHAASDDLVDRMAELLGGPQKDPHGAPIPARDGSVDDTIYRSLDSLEPGDAGCVIRVLNDDAAMLRHFGELGLRPGASVFVDSRAPFGGPITFEVGGRRQAIGPLLAAQVLIDMQMLKMSQRNQP